MTDERDKSSRGRESVARPTARDVPFVRGAASDEEAPPRARRPEQLPRDPSYEAELAQVELAVMRDPQRRADPSTKPHGRAHYASPASLAEPPPSVTPESPVTHRPREPVSRSPEPPASSSGRAVASGTLLSVGSVDPRGKTERTLETPRMFFSQQGASTEAYFKPGKIPAVTVHQTLETETVKLSDSIDPRRAKTLPRIDRAMLERLARVAPAESEEGDRESDDFEKPASAASAPIAWNRADFEPTTPIDDRLQDDPPEDDRLQDGQIHASLSPFREHAAPSYEFDGSPTRPEPFVVRRASDPPETFVPDPSAVPTQRDLPQHRIEASRPPPAPVLVAPATAELRDSSAPISEIAGPTTASIITEDPAPPRPWLRLLAFAAAVLSAVVLGWWLTRQSGSDESAKVPEKAAPRPTAAIVSSPASSAVADVAVPPPAEATATAKPASKTQPMVATGNAPRTSPPRAASDIDSGNSTSAPAAPTTTAVRKPTKPARETIF